MKHDHLRMMLVVSTREPNDREQVQRAISSCCDWYRTVPYAQVLPK